jgi:1-acyl-sn-glycerol-3-phosphate acyltransferase
VPTPRRKIVPVTSIEHPAYHGATRLQDRWRAVSRPVARRLWKLHLEGFERLPETGPAILCPNHISFLDSAFLMLAVSRRISFVGKAEYMDSWKTKHVFPRLGMIPIDRTGGDRAQCALEAAEAVLRRGELFGIFPEGTRSRDGVLYRGHTGAARLAVKVGCPIFPVGIIGTRDIQPPEARMPKVGGHCTIRVGRPVPLDRYQSGHDERLVLRQIIDEVMFEIRELSGQEYRDVYATRQAESIPSETARVAHVDETPAAAEAVLTNA